MCKDSVPYLTMAGAMKLVSAYFQPMADLVSSWKVTPKMDGCTMAGAMKALGRHALKTTFVIRPGTCAHLALALITLPLAVMNKTMSHLKRRLFERCKRMVASMYRFP